MLAANTLVALACLMANKGPVDTTALEAQLSATDDAQVQAIIQSGACLPENMENLLKQTHDSIQSGELPNFGVDKQPTMGCG
jgi:hypothetical protein